MFKLLKYFYRQTKKIIPQASAPIVLCYHAVSKLTTSDRPFVVSQENFIEHLKVINEHYNPIGLSEFQDALVRGVFPERAVLVTFDDNYKEHLTVAMPLLEEMKVPAVVFIGSGFIDKNREYFWDELERLILASNSLPSTIELENNGAKKYWHINGQGPVVLDWVKMKPHFGSRQKAYFELMKLLSTMDLADLDYSMSELREQIGDDGIARETHRLLSKQELIELCDSEWIEIGSHTCNHLLLATKPVETQIDEIVQDKSALERWLKRPITCLAYPYGGPDDIGERAVEIARQAGFGMAFTTDWQPVRKNYDLFRLPRLIISNLTGDEFRSAIHFWN